MKVWIIRDLEPLASDPGGPRLLRAGMLATTLAAQDHETTWFTSTFNHYSRRQREAGCLQPSKNLSIRVLPAPGYRHNIGLRRILHNRQFAAAFSSFAKHSETLPDILVTDLPTTEAAQAVVALGRRIGRPTVVSIRDLWPDFFSNFAPKIFRPLVNIAVRPLDNQARFACRHATSVIGISDHYLAWGQEKGGRSNIDRDRVFPLGYLPPLFPHDFEANETLRAMHVPPGKYLVSFVGSWGATYDLPLVIEAARKLTHRDDVLFVLAGDGPERAELAKSARDLDNVIMPGWLGPNDISALLSSSAVGLLPYVEGAPQGLPNKVFEYMAFGAYQIATLSGEAEKLYSETAIGRSVSHTPQAFADAVESAISDRSTMEARQHRIDIFNARFHAHKIYRKMTDHIIALAEEARP